MLYLRIAVKREHRWAIFAVMGIVVTFYLASEVVTIFQCTPISKVWNKKQPGHCIEILKFYYANAGVNIATDLMILLLPIPVIKSLNLPKREKFALAFLFLLGSIVCVISCLRLKALMPASKPDTTWNTAVTTIWTEAEMNVAITCACLPVLRGLVFPKKLTRKTSCDSNAPTFVENLTRQNTIDETKPAMQSTWPASIPGDSTDELFALAPVHGRTHSSIHAVERPKSFDQLTLRDDDGRIQDEEEGIRKTTNVDVTYDKTTRMF